MGVSVSVQNGGCDRSNGSDHGGGVLAGVNVVVFVKTSERLTVWWGSRFCVRLDLGLRGRISVLP